MFHTPLILQICQKLPAEYYPNEFHGLTCTCIIHEESTLSLSKSSDIHGGSVYHNKVATPFSTVFCLLAANILTDVVFKVLEQTARMVSGLSSAVCLREKLSIAAKFLQLFPFPRHSISSSRDWR